MKAPSRKDSSSSPLSARSHRLELHAPEAAIIRAVVARLTRDMPLAEAVLFVTDVAVSPLNEPASSHAKECQAKATGSAPTSSATHATSQPKRKRSAMKLEALRLKRAAYFESQARRLREQLQTTPPVPKQAPQQIAVLSEMVAGPAHQAEPPPVLAAIDSSLERALDVSAAEFASPPRGASAAVTRVATPQRNEFMAAMSLRRRQAAPTSPQPPQLSLNELYEQRRHWAIDFVKRNVAPGAPT